MSKAFWAVIAIIVVIFSGIVVFNKNQQEASGTDAQPTNHVVGNTEAGVTLVEYADFECPYCGQYYPMVQQIKEQYKDQIAFQFRHLPLVQVHKNALAAARASEAAAKQGKFWEMYDLIFQNQSAWSKQDDASSAFVQYAAQLNLDMEKFKADVANRETNDIINADIAEFKKTKEEMSTPTFFLNGQKIKPASMEEFTKLIDEAIAAKKQQQ